VRFGEHETKFETLADCGMDFDKKGFVEEDLANVFNNGTSSRIRGS
jgi:hypothetical protein